MSDFNWTNELIFELIDLYHKRPLLWDTTIEDYKDRVKKHAAWREIGRSMNTDAVTVQRKMRMLIGQFRRELIKTNPASKWFAFKKLMFLKSPQSRRTNSGRFKNKHRERGATYFIAMGPETQDHEHEQADGQRKDQAELNDILSEFTESSNGDRKKLQKKSSQEGYNNMLQEIETEVQARDEYNTYGELVAMKLRKIPNSYARSTAQYHINNILYKAEIGAYDQRQSYSFQSRENFTNRASSSSTQRIDSNYDEHSQLSSSASKSIDDLLKLENEDSDD